MSALVMEPEASTMGEDVDTVTSWGHRGPGERCYANRAVLRSHRIRCRDSATTKLLMSPRERPERGHAERPERGEAPP